MTTTLELPMLLTEVAVAAVSRPSPSFVRVELAGPGLADLGIDGPWLDQRFKLVFPNAAGSLPTVSDVASVGLSAWLQLPAEERGHLRTYTVRDVLGWGAATRLVVDIVVHEPPCGPGSTWARSARVGDRVVLLGPRRGAAYGGIEFAPPASTTELLLVGDETALPAIASIVGSLPGDARGRVFVEVPVGEDVVELDAPPGVVVTWLVRQGGAPGARLVEAVAARMSVRMAGRTAGRPAGPPAAGPSPAVALATDAEIDPDLWETPGYSSSGEPLAGGGGGEGGDGVLPGLYAWIAGESSMVTALRRHLVRDLGIDRSQVAFMGYWRRGVAMRG